MPNQITIKIDVTLLDKARFFRTGKLAKDGHQPIYCDLVLIPRKEVGKFGDTHMVKQSLSKADREAGVQLPIIGDATERVYADAQPKPAPAPKPAQTSDDEADDVPF